MQFEYDKLLGGVTTKQPNDSAVFDNVKRYFNTISLAGSKLDEYNKSLFVFAAVSKIAENVGFGDLRLYEIVNSDGEREQVRNHEALDRLYNPNPFETKTEFWEKLSIHLSLTGDAFILKVRGENTDDVQELYNLRPDRMRTVSGTDKLVDRYEFTRSGGVTTFDPDDIVHIKYPSPLSRLVGTSPIEAAADRVKTEKQAGSYQKNFFENSARPDFILETDGNLNKNQKEDLKRSWQKEHQGAKNAGAMAVLEGGLKYQQISMGPKDVDYIETMKHTRDDILSAFGVPKPLIAMDENINRSTAETAKAFFLENKVYPELQRIVEKLNYDFIIPEYGQEYELEAVDPTPENQEKKRKRYQAGLEGNYLVPNEIRRKEGLPPLEGGWSIFQPASERAVGGVPQDQRKSMEQDKNADNLHGKEKLQATLNLKDNIKGKVKQTLQEGAKKHVHETSAHSKKADDGVVRFVEDTQSWAKARIKQMDNQADVFADKLKAAFAEQKQRVLNTLQSQKSYEPETKSLAGDIFDNESENEILSDLTLPFIQDFITSSGQESMNTVDPATDFTVTQTVQDFIESRSQDLARQVNNTTLNGLERTLSEGIANGEGQRKLADRVKDEYDKFADYRARRIARTETTVANNEGFLRSYMQTDAVNAKEWIAVIDDRTRPSHVAINGEVVPVEKSFSNGLMRPGEPNCRCVIGGVYKEGL